MEIHYLINRLSYYWIFWREIRICSWDIVTLWYHWGRRKVCTECWTVIFSKVLSVSTWKGIQEYFFLNISFCHFQMFTLLQTAIKWNLISLEINTHNKLEVLLTLLLKGISWKLGISSSDRQFYKSLVWIKAFLCETSCTDNWSAAG